MSRNSQRAIPVAVFALLLPLSNYRILAQPAMSPDLTLDLYVTPVVHLSDLGLLLLVVAAALRLLIDGFRSPGGGWLACVLLPGAIALAAAPFASHSTGLAGYVAVRWLLGAAAFLALCQFPEHGRRFTTWFLGGLALHVAVGVAQVVLQRPIGLPLELALPPQQPGAAIVSVADRNWLRAYGLMFHPNVFGGFLVAGILLALPRLESRTMRIIWWLYWAGLLLTFSRSAFLAVTVVVLPAALCLVRSRPELRRSLWIAGGGVLLVGVLGAVTMHEQIATRLSLKRAAEIFSLSERGEQMEVAAKLIVANPVFGVGAGNFPIAVADTDVETRPLPVHNVGLLLAAEVGVVGGLTWLGTLVLLIVGIRRAVRNRVTEAIPPFFAALALWIVGLFDYYPWGLNVGRLLFMTMLALGAAHTLRVSREP